MAENEVKQVIVLEADKSSAAATQRLLKGVSDDIKDLGKGNQLKGLQDSFKALPQGAQNLADRFQKGVEVAKDLVDTYDDLIEREKKLTAAGQPGPAPKSKGQAAGPKTRIEQFEEVEQTSGKVGDLGDALAALGSATGIDALGNIGALFEGIEALARAKAGFEALPETLDATAKSVGLFKTAQATAAATSVAATAAEGAQAAANTTVAGTSVAATGGIVAMTIALGPVAAIGIAIGVAVGAAFVLVKSAVDAFAASAEENGKKITRAYEATDTVFDAILGGSTTEDARKKIEEEELKLKQANDEAAKAFQQGQQRFAEIAAKYGTAAAEIAKNRGTDEFDKFAARQKEQLDLARQSEANIKSWNEAIEKNAFAVGDAAEAEKKRKDEEEKAKRAAEQRAKEIEGVQQNIADSTRKYGEKQQDDARQAVQKLQDIEQGAADKRADNALKYQDDLRKIALDAKRNEIDAVRKQQQDEADARIKDQQSLIDATLKQQQVLEDIRTNALRDEADALRNRNFLQAALVSENTKENLEDANKTAERELKELSAQQQREAEERNLGYQRAAQDRAIANQRARQDQAIAYQQQQRDAVTAYQRQLRDAEIARLRQEETTRIGYEREQMQLQEHMNKLLGIAAQGQAAELAIRAGGTATALRSASTTNNTSNATNITDNRSLKIDLTGGGAALIQQAVERTVLQTMQKVSYR